MKIILSLVLLVVVKGQKDSFIFPDQFEQTKQKEQIRNYVSQNPSVPPPPRAEPGAISKFTPSIYDQFLTPKRRDHGQKDSFIFPNQFEQMKQEEQIRNYVSQNPAVMPPPSAGPGAVSKFRPSIYDQFLSRKWRDHVSGIISRGTTKFTLDVDRAIENSSRARPDTLLFSPASLSMAMAMVLLASRGKTFDEVAKILGLESGIDITNHSEIVHQIFGLIIQEYKQRIRNNPNEPRCDAAFGMFVDDSFPIRPQFKNISEKLYQNEIINVDFSGHARQAKDAINHWVSHKTMNKIRDMLDKAPDPTTKVMILSALYFNGEWESHFQEGVTRKKDFTVENGETIYVDMMYNDGEFVYGEDPYLGLKIIELPYKGKEVSMFVLMPDVSSATALKDLKARLSPEYIEYLIGSMKKATCIVGLPKMKLSNTLNLRRVLQSLGLQTLFNPQTADLSILSPGTNEYMRANQQASSVTQSQVWYHKYSEANKNFNGFNRRYKRQASRSIDQEFVRYLNSIKLPKFGVDELRNSAGIRNPGLYADDVIHKVEMTINERGTEAAAATLGGLNDRYGDSERFIADKPFLFFIRHNPTKIKWFWGTINRPSPHYMKPLRKW